MGRCCSPTPLNGTVTSPKNRRSLYTGTRNRQRPSTTTSGDGSVTPHCRRRRQDSPTIRDERPTDHEYVRYRDCGVETLTARQTNTRPNYTSGTSRRSPPPTVTVGVLTSSVARTTLRARRSWSSRRHRRRPPGATRSSGARPRSRAPPRRRSRASRPTTPWRSVSTESPPE